jgi:hypothetical protein
MRDASSYAIQLGVQTELAKLHLEAQRGSDFYATQDTLQKIQSEAKETRDAASTALWPPFYPYSVTSSQIINSSCRRALSPYLFTSFQRSK